MSRAVRLAIAVVLVSACGGASQLDAGASVSVTGKVRDASGRPVAGTQVLLEREPGIGEAFTGLLELTASLGLACFSHNPPAICKDHSHSATTGADGSYTFYIHGSDSQTEFGNAATMLLLARGPDGDFTLESFVIQASSLKLPELRFWDAKASIQLNRSSTTMKWTAPGQGYFTAKSYSVSFAAATTEIWSLGAASAGAQFDSRVLEDQHGQAHVTATGHSTAEGTTVDVEYNSAPLAFTGPAGAPPSRGLPCRLDGKPIQPCWLTGPPPGQPFGCGQLCQAKTVTLDFGAQRKLSLVVLHSCGMSCQVEGSLDGASWFSLGTPVSGSPYAQVPVHGTARYVRVTPGSNVGLMRELAVW